MTFVNLNGWQRLWVLASIIYLAFLIFTIVTESPSPWNSTIAADEIIKGLSSKTLETSAKLYPLDKIPEDIDEHIYYLIHHNEAGSRFSSLPLRIFTMKASPYDKQAIEYIDSNLTIKEYISKDYNNVESNIITKNRIYFIGKVILIWVIPCITVYILGLLIHWVYKGFIKIK